MDQNVDPRQAGIDWNAFRESQREVAREAVAGALVLDEVARREQLEVDRDEVEQEVGALRGADRAHAGGGAGARSRKKAACRASMRGCAGRSRLTSSWRVLQLRSE